MLRLSLVPPRRQTQDRKTAKDLELGSGLSECPALVGLAAAPCVVPTGVGLWKRRERGSSTTAGSTDVSSRDSSICPVKCGFIAPSQSDGKVVSRLWASHCGASCSPASEFIRDQT
ncbi:hypothetical protein LA080_002275 [Diaporthe eres]|nr:hypothetical protein LA080_002275 [Diaporthe eres]